MVLLADLLCCVFDIDRSRASKSSPEPVRSPSRESRRYRGDVTTRYGYS
jgi:hypothetical protein